ncbi:hypothetical protein F5Y15DRAFT_411002 [Xylariaceae sp. FL0016]|nr:hypothetical protein F5Y15DRAFT_411002 [Xylariaceae sp. FL0016]
MIFPGSIFVEFAASVSAMKIPKSLTIRSGSEVPASSVEGLMEWTGRVKLGGPNVTLYGDIHQVAAQIRQANPDFDFTPSRRANDTKSDDVSPDGRQFYCNVGMDGPAQDWAIYDGIDYLNGNHGTCTVGPGLPGAAGFGEYGSSAPNIGRCDSDRHSNGLCNDNSHPISFSCDILAGYAQTVADECENVKAGIIWGQAFTTDNSWNVIAAHEKAGC